MTQKPTIIEQFNEKFTIKDQMLECVGEDRGTKDYKSSRDAIMHSNYDWGYNQAKEEIREAIISKFGK